MISARKILAGLADILLPRTCPLCGESLPPGGQRPLCPACLGALERLHPPWCPTCGKPFVSEIALDFSPYHLCADCRALPPAYDRARALGPMEGALREMVHLIKYRGHTTLLGELVPQLGRLACEEFPETAGAAGALVTFVPIDPLRWRERGFDQAKLLAQKTADFLQLPWDQTLTRRRGASPQTRLRAAERRRNLRGVFHPSAKLDLGGKRLLLMDDVLTTGSTASACARALKQAGAERVDVLTICTAV